MVALYNEWERYPAQWTRNLIAAGHVAPGVVDERSIRDLTAADVRDFRQCHFFSGIAVWSYALRLAGVPDDAEVWTGSCPCQPFSVAGRGGGFSDERHLWPVWFRLIHKCRPAVVFGEQVASADGLVWLDAVRADLEGAGYIFGAADLCAAGVGAPHIRQRAYFVAYADEQRPQGWIAQLEGSDQRDSRKSGMADPWSGCDWIACSDGKARPTEPGTFPLAHGAPARVGRLRATGNAIVPQVAATFIRAAMEAV